MSEKTTFLFGSSKKSFSFPVDFFPYRSFRGRYYTGIHDPIHVRCFYFQVQEERLLLLSMELGDLGDISVWQERISTLTGVPQDHIFLSVTHNHEAPHVSDDYHQDVVDVQKTQAFASLVLQATEAAVLQAVKTAQPANLGFGEGMCDINVNRDYIINGRSIMAPNPHGISDKSVGVVKVVSTEGLILAYLVNYAVHGVVMFDSAQKDGGMLISGDLPGRVCSILEERHDGNVVAMFTSGAAGDQLPRYMAKRIVHDGKGGRLQVDAGASGWLLLEVQAENLADEVLRVAKQLKFYDGEPFIRAQQRVFTVLGQKKTERPMDVPEDYVFEDGDPVLLPLGVFFLGPFAFIGIPAEPVCSIGLEIKQSIPVKHVMLITHCNGSLSYISDEAGYRHKSFEAVVSHFKRGCGRETLVEGSVDMVSSLLPRERRPKDV